MPMTTRNYPPGITQDPTSLTAFPPPPSPTATPSPPDASPINSAFSCSIADDRTRNKVAEAPPSGATAAVLLQSEPIPENWKCREVRGIDFDDYTGRHVTVADLVKGMTNIGFQASNLAKACQIIDEMRTWRYPEDQTQKAAIFLGYTSNLVSSGLRETIRYLVQHRHVSAIVTTAGGVEEDLIKCLAPTYLGSFSLDGATLRSRGLNRIGNLLVPNNNYCEFEDWLIPILDKMHQEQELSRTDPTIPLEGKLNWTPSKVIHRLGKEINNTSSILYWAYKNNIPIFCPALTDGSLGDMLYFHSFRCPPNMQPLKVDILEDIRRINTISVRAKAAGMIILGGGVIKHHIANACLMRNGAEWAVIINVAGEFDGSDSGARPDEAVSWGKIKPAKSGGKMVKVYGEATIVFPLVVAATFARPPDVVKKPEPHKQRSESTLRPELLHSKLAPRQLLQHLDGSATHSPSSHSRSRTPTSLSHAHANVRAATPTETATITTNPPLSHTPLTNLTKQLTQPRSTTEKSSQKEKEKEKEKEKDKDGSSTNSESLPPTSAASISRPSTATSTIMATAASTSLAVVLPAAGIGVRMGTGLASPTKATSGGSSVSLADGREKGKDRDRDRDRQ